MKKLFGEANINVENFNEAERKQKIKVKYYKLTASEVKEDEKKFGIALVKEENDGFEPTIRCNCLFDYFLVLYRERDSNPHEHFCSGEFKSPVASITPSRQIICGPNIA